VGIWKEMASNAEDTGDTGGRPEEEEQNTRIRKGVRVAEAEREKSEV
jgi:hypothetical protein